MSRASFFILCISLELWAIQACNGGKTVPHTDFNSVNKALGDVLKQCVKNSKACAIGFANVGKGTLSSPKYYLKSGSLEGNVAASIDVSQSGLALFQKKSYSTFGSTGLLSYDIDDTRYKVVVMWDNPWNSVMYNIEFNVKIYRKELETDKEMYNQMKDYAGSIRAKDGWLEKNEQGIKVRATLSDDSHARLYVSVDSSGYDRRLPSQFHTACSHHATWFGSYCWQECSPTGYCWTEKKCKKDKDCAGPLQCYEKCTKT